MGEKNSEGSEGIAGAVILSPVLGADAGFL